MNDPEDALSFKMLWFSKSIFCAQHLPLNQKPSFELIGRHWINNFVLTQSFRKFHFRLCVKTGFLASMTVKEFFFIIIPQIAKQI